MSAGRLRVRQASQHLDPKRKITERNKIMAVTLVKASDVPGYTNLPYFTRQWIATAELRMGLGERHGGGYGSYLYEGLAKNDPNAFRATLPALANVPDHKGSSTTHAAPVDYSDGYGHTYAVGE